MPFNLGLFLDAIMEAKENNNDHMIEELVHNIKTYIEDLEDELHQLKLDNQNLEGEVDRLREEVNDLECQVS